MRVKIVKLRERGSRLPQDKITLASAIEEELELIQYISTRRGYSYARITEQKRAVASIRKLSLRT